MHLPAARRLRASGCCRLFAGRSAVQLAVYSAKSIARLGPRAFSLSLCAALALGAGPGHTRGGILPSVRARTTDSALVRPESVPSDAELEAAGARIGTISVDPRNIFDTTKP